MGPDSNHAPAVKEDDCHGDGVEHGFRAQFEPFLAVPKGVYTDSLERSLVIVVLGPRGDFETQD